MKISRFVKDLLLTGFSQMGVLLFTLLFVKIMSQLLTKESFGVLVMWRRTSGVLFPLLTFSLGLSLTKFVSADVKKGTHYLKLAVAATNICLGVTVVLLLAAPEAFSKLLFEDAKYTALVQLFPFFLFTGCLQLLIYSFYRGKQQMNTANMVNLVWFGFPVALALATLYFLGNDNTSIALIYYYGAFTALTLPVLIFFLYQKKALSVTEPFMYKWSDIKGFMLYGLNRLPASLLLSGIFYLPVFWATHKNGMEAVGYLGLALMILRMMELFTDPFNRIFLPKFSELTSESCPEEIRSKCGFIVDFIITFLPLVVAFVHGLSPKIVYYWVGPRFDGAIIPIQITILFSGFYLAYALIRGILNGLYTFPYVNVVCGIGAGALVVSILLYNKDASQISVCLGLGLTGMGISSTAILLKKIKWLPPLKTVATYTLLTAALAVGLHFGDQYVMGIPAMNVHIQTAALLLYRAVALALVFALFWRRTVWFNELLKRINLKKTKEA